VHSGCNQCCNENDVSRYGEWLSEYYYLPSTIRYHAKQYPTVSVYKLDIVHSYRGAIIYKCKKCNYYWFYKYWEDDLDMDWMMETENFETPRICRIMVPITEKEYSLFTKTPKKSISYKMFSNRKQFIRRKQ
tara:strand:+ start:181 stop:576 length:396 start_codon:yes stop_codon:yes gene_type:complete